MTGQSSVTDPDGKAWTVRSREVAAETVTP
jgi:hypothetical protein